MASDSPSDVSNKMIKAQTVGLGFRVKSGWAAVVLLTDAAHSLQLADVRVGSSCAMHGLPEARQPYHAAMGKTRNGLDKSESARACAYKKHFAAVTYKTS